MKWTVTINRENKKPPINLTNVSVIVKNCGYMSDKEKKKCQMELLFHVTKHLKVKKWVRTQTAQNETVTFNKLLMHAKQHEATVKDFN